MKRLIYGALVGLLMMTAVGCSNEPEVTEEVAVDETVETTAEEATSEEATSEEAAVEAAPAEAEDVIEEAEATEASDLEAPYEMADGYDEYMVMEHYFEGPDETVTMMVSADAAHGKYHTHFDFFGEEQVLEFEVVDGVPTVIYDKTGFIGKDIENIYADIMANDAWMAAGAATEASDLEAPYEMAEGYAKYMVMEHYFEGPDETVTMMVSMDADNTKYHTHFDFFGEEQVLEFEVVDGVPTVLYDMTGFIGKDIENIYSDILANK